MIQNEDKLKKLGSFLYVARTSMGITAREIATIIAVNRTLITQWENGDILPALKRCNQIVEVYKVNPVEFSEIMQEALEYRKILFESRKQKVHRKKSYLREILPPFVFRG